MMERHEAYHRGWKDGYYKRVDTLLQAINHHYAEGVAHGRRDLDASCLRVRALPKCEQCGIPQVEHTMSQCDLDWFINNGGTYE